MEKELRARIGTSIKTWRKKCNLTMNQLAELAEVDSGFLAYIEGGHKTPSLLTVSKLAKGLGIPVSRLFQNLPSDTVDPDYEFTQQVRALFHGRTPSQKAELIGLLKQLRKPEKVRALKQLIRR